MTSMRRFCVPWRGELVAKWYTNIRRRIRRTRVSSYTWMRLVVRRTRGSRVHSALGNLRVAAQNGSTFERLFGAYKRLTFPLNEPCTT